MANYNYHCFDCEKVANEKHKDLLVADGDGGLQLPADLYDELVLFETSHSVNPTDEELHEATECPRCKGHNCEKSLFGSQAFGYIRGYGWLDKAGATRDRNRYTLANNDPYAEYRTPGEVDHIDQQLRRGGQHNPKPQYYSPPTKNLEKAVKKSVDTKTE